MANARLCPQVTDVLRRSTITGNLLILPEGHIDFYPKVKKALEAAGGKWNRSKQGFLFSSDPRPKLGLALETGVVMDEKKLRQAFYTPKAVANEVARLADLDGHLVLEPSAGDGALVEACLAYGARSVEAIEIHEGCRQRLIGNNRIVIIADFLTVKPEPRFKRVVMNPPYTKGQDLKHVTHAKKFLAPGGLLFAIVPSKDCPKFAALGAETVEVFEAGSFKESGTNIETRLICIHG